MIELDMDAVKAKAAECLNKAFEKLISNGLTNATSFGFWIDGRFGFCGVALNEDDDSTFHCQEIYSFTRRQFMGIWLEEIGNLDSRLRAEPGEEGDVEKPIKLVDSEWEIEIPGMEAFYEHLHQAAMLWVKEWLESNAIQHWHPCWVLVEETNSGLSEHWRVKKRKLPASGEIGPDSVRRPGLSAEASSLKVYALPLTPRKYATLYRKFTVDDVRLWAQSVIGNVQTPFVLQRQGNGRKTGDLARFQGLEAFAIRSDALVAEQAMEFLSEYAEFIPAHDGQHDWFVVNVLRTEDVLDVDSSRFDMKTDPSSRLKIAEFDAEKLRTVDSPLFKLTGHPRGEIYFLERPGQESLLQFCERTGLRGLEWSLVWSESVADIEKELDAFAAKLEARLVRLTGTAEVSNYLNYECITQRQAFMWRLAKTRQILASNGVKEVLRQIKGLGSLEIPLIARKLPGMWQYDNEPRPQGIESSLDKAFKKKNFLLDMRGYLCVTLPIAIGSLSQGE